MNKLSINAFQLKLIAIISMLLNHTTVALWPIVPLWLHIPVGFIRGITFPIMAFFVVEGFRRTRNIKKYMLRLAIFGAIAQIPYTLVFGLFILNIVFTILIGLCCLLLHEKLYVEKGKKALFVVLFVLINIFFSFVVPVEGQFAGILLIFLFKVIKKSEMSRRTIPLIIIGVVNVIGGLATYAMYQFAASVDEIGTLLIDELGHGLLAGHTMMMSQYFVLPLGTFLIIPLLRAYNGELGKRAKFLFYTVYPGHFIILGLIAFALGLLVLPVLM